MNENRVSIDLSIVNSPHRYSVDKDSNILSMIEEEKVE
jgi:hypothetical protein